MQSEHVLKVENISLCLVSVAQRVKITGHLHFGHFPWSLCVVNSPFSIKVKGATAKENIAPPKKKKNP
jgi:hypothetical protein